jgi:chitin disaccharide deacetylase
MKNIVLCADDFGLHEDVNAAILYLFRNKRISATSCMTNMPCFCEKTTSELKKFMGDNEIGLHFNLTEGFPLTDAKTLIQRDGRFSGLFKLMFKAHLHSLNYDDVYRELNAQYQRFILCMNRLPSHIDGHQHIHHLPIIRRALVDFLNEKGLFNKLYIRNVASLSSLSESIPSFMKEVVIFCTGAQRFKQQLIANKIHYNQTFAGVYAFNQSLDYRQQFISFIVRLQNKGLMMCHPSVSVTANDPIAQYRKKEFDYLSSDIFIEDQGKYDFRISKLL